LTDFSFFNFFHKLGDGHGDLDMGFDWSMVKILCNVSATLPDFPTNVPQQVNEPNVKTITFILSCSIF